MSALNPPVCDFDWPAPDFALPATDGKIYRLSNVVGENGTLIMFICNHCPFVLAILDRIIRDAHELKALGIGVAAICSNDADNYPADSSSPTSSSSSLALFESASRTRGRTGARRGWIGSGVTRG